MYIRNRKIKLRLFVCVGITSPSIIMEADDESTPPVAAVPSHKANFTPHFQTYTVTKTKEKAKKAKSENQLLF
jgi:hypothetical protein